MTVIPGLGRARTALSRWPCYRTDVDDGWVSQCRTTTHGKSFVRVQVSAKQAAESKSNVDKKIALIFHEMANHAMPDPMGNNCLARIKRISHKQLGGTLEQLYTLSSTLTGQLTEKWLLKNHG